VSPELPPNVGFSMLKKALLAGMAIVLMSGAAVSAAGFLQADDIINILEENGREAIPIPEAEIDYADAGEPRTIMVIGSDKRKGGIDKDRPALSDTIILMRLDRDKQATAIMSIPRDLKVDIPGLQYQDKINAAYANGGARKTLKTVKQLLSTPEREFEINHVINIDFGGFRRAIDYIGGAYIDVDRRYFNDRGGSCAGCFAVIDVPAGYQRMNGTDALSYVRYRHTDNDLIRSARQQDFLRQVKAQDSVRKLMDFGKRRTLAKIFARYFDTDKSLRKKSQIFALLKLALFTAKNPIREVNFRIDVTKTDPAYLYTSPTLLKRTVDEFLQVRASDRPRTKPQNADDGGSTSKKKKTKKGSVAIPAGLEISKQDGEDQAVLAGPKLKGRLPFYFPTLRYRGSRYANEGLRVYRIRDAKGKLHRAYRLTVAKPGIGEYYGIQGMTWRAPPILDDPSETRRIAGRKYELHFDGRRLRLVAWRTAKGVYWVSNTLTQSLDTKQMLGIATSLKRLGQK
jgi:LCP family protein required for cell wall assembly